MLWIGLLRIGQLLRDRFIVLQFELLRTWAGPCCPLPRQATTATGLRPHFIAIYCETLVIPQPAKRRLPSSAPLGRCASRKVASRLRARSSTSWLTPIRCRVPPMIGCTTIRFWSLSAGRAFVRPGSRSGTVSSRHRFRLLPPEGTNPAC